VDFEISEQIAQGDRRSVLVLAQMVNGNQTASTQELVDMDVLDLAFQVPSGGDTETWNSVADGADVPLNLGSPQLEEGQVVGFTPCTMPRVRIELNNAGGLPPGTEYKFEIGEEDGHALSYRDSGTNAIAAGIYRHPPSIDSGWLTAPATNPPSSPDTLTWEINWNANDEVANHGIYGGHLNNVRVHIRPPGQAATDREFIDNPNSAAEFNGIYVVGAALSQTHTNEFINQLTYADINGHTGNEINDPSLTQLRTMLRGISRHETLDGSHYWRTGYGVGRAEHDRYPLREWDPGSNPPATGHYMPGYGIMQLSESAMWNRRTIWDWQENIKRGSVEVVGHYNTAYNNLHAHPVDVFTTYPTNVSLAAALRFQTYAKYNGGSAANYYWWNVQGSVVACTAITSSATANTEAHTPTATELDLQIAASLSGLSAIALQNGPTSAAASVVTWQGAMPTSTPFSWNDIGLTLATSQGADFVSGTNQDEINIYLALTHNGNVVRHQVHEGAVSPNSVVATGGFRPLAGGVKMGYIPVGASTTGYRDYNNDGVRDQSGNVFSIPTFGNSGAANVGTDNRAPRYADHASAEE
jgi:hypothetical protein